MTTPTMQPKTRLDPRDAAHAGVVLLSATTITGDDVVNMQQEKLGKIQDVMLDMTRGQIRYAVLASGGFLGMGDRLFAIPWKALKLDKDNKRFMLDVALDRLKDAPGFDKDQWPNMADANWNATVESYFGQQPSAPGS
jgi:sporulation protein YlmC with PRC-barrel domain